MMVEAYNVGRLLHDYFESEVKNVCLVISCDLAHTHSILKGPKSG